MGGITVCEWGYAMSGFVLSGRGRLIAKVVALVVFALPLGAQLDDCFEDCHAEGMKAYENILFYGGSEMFAIHHGQRVFAPCIAAC